VGGLIDKLKSLAQAKVPKGLPKDEAQAYFEEALKGLLASPPPELAPGQGVPLAAGEYAKPGDIIHPGSLDDVKPGGVTVFAYDPGYGGPGQDPPPKLGFGASLSGVEKKAVADSVGEHLAKLQAANAMIGNPALLGPGGPKKLIGPEIKNLDWLTGIPSSALPIDPKTPMSEIATISDGVPPDFDHDAAAALFGQLKAAGQGAKAAPKSGLGLVAPVHSQQSLLKVATVAEISMVGGDGPATLKVTGFNQHGQPMTEYLKLTAGGQFKPIYDAQALSYKKSYAPLHFSGDLMEEAKASGALDKQVAAELKALQQEHAKAMADHVYGALISKIDTTPGKESITMSAAPGDVAYKSKPAAPAKPNPGSSSAATGCPTTAPRSSAMSSPTGAWTASRRRSSSWRRPRRLRCRSGPAGSRATGSTSSASLVPCSTPSVSR
jgi:hypothetical protein